MPLPWSALKTKNLEYERNKNSQHFKIRVGDDATEPRKRMLSCFSAPHPPINRDRGWAPNKTISPQPGTHLRLYYEQRSAAAGTERFEAEIILSAISYKYLTEKGERERWGERKRQGGGQAGAVGWRGCLKDLLKAQWQLRLGDF